MLRLQGWLLPGEPLERHLGLAPRPRGALNLLQGPSVLAANGTLELGFVRSEHAPQSANRYPKIMKGLAIEAIVQPAFRRHGRAEPFERKPPRRFLFVTPQDVVGQSAPPPRFVLAIDRWKSRDLRNG